jgi:DNA helicase IV
MEQLMTLKQSPAELKRLERNIAKNQADKAVTMAELMAEYTRLVERRLGRRLTRDEALNEVRPVAIAHAKVTTKLLGKKKGIGNGN